MSTLVSFALANLGLTKIIDYAVPVVMFLYPLAIVIILLSLCSPLFNDSRIVFAWTIGFTFIGAIYDFCNTLQKIQTSINLKPVLKIFSE